MQIYFFIFALVAETSAGNPPSLGDSEDESSDSSSDGDSDFETGRHKPSQEQLLLASQIDWDDDEKCATDIKAKFSSAAETNIRLWEIALKDTTPVMIPRDKLTVDLMFATDKLHTLEERGCKELVKSDKCEEYRDAKELVASLRLQIDDRTRKVTDLIEDKALGVFQLGMLFDPIAYVMRKFQEWMSMREGTAEIQKIIALEITGFVAYVVARAVGDPILMNALLTVLAVAAVSKGSVWMFDAFTFAWKMISDDTRNEIVGLIPHNFLEYYARAQVLKDKLVTKGSEVAVKAHSALGKVGEKIFTKVRNVATKAGKTINEAKAVIPKVPEAVNDFNKGLQSLSNRLSKEMKHVTQTAVDKVKRSTVIHFMSEAMSSGMSSVTELGKRFFEKFDDFLKDKERLKALGELGKIHWISCSYEFIRAMFTEPLSGIIISSLLLEFSFGRVALIQLIRSGRVLFKRLGDATRLIE